MSTQSWMSSQQTCPWQPAAKVPELRPGNIHLWWLPLSGSGKQIERLRDTLTADELKRADRFRFAQHRQAYTFARGSLRLLLSGYSGDPAECIRFEYGSFGKPRLTGDATGSQLCFNYSDAGGHAIYAFARDAEVGVDLEDLDREVSFDRIVERKFTAAESAAIRALPEAKRKPAFLACWTRKEGYGKAEGWGIRYPLDSVETCLDCETPRTEVDVDRTGKNSWVIRQVYPSHHFVGALVYPRATEVDDSAIKYMQTSPATLLQD